MLSRCQIGLENKKEKTGQKAGAGMADRPEDLQYPKYSGQSFPSKVRAPGFESWLSQETVASDSGSLGLNFPICEIGGESEFRPSDARC